MKLIKDKSIDKFLEELASKHPTPGGGSVAAMMGAQAAALVSMVCNLTLGKPKYAEVEADMQALLAEAEALRETFIGMIKADIDVFNHLMACYGLPKAGDDEKAHRNNEIQLALQKATEVPLVCARACAKAMALSRAAAEKGNINVVSDAGVAVMAAYSGLKSAALNVNVNAGGVKDRQFADAMLAELQEVMQYADGEAEAVYQLVSAKL
jgi:formiminotetrahydrofolate cyclodeaminase